ncbi:PLP-dependent transferase [Actinomadura soli]|nr:PLP-dependent transferase [Actinomadura soli]
MRRGAGEGRDAGGGGRTARAGELRAGAARAGVRGALPPGRGAGRALHVRTDGNPTWTLLERAIGELEGGAEAVSFSSGMAAVASVLLSQVRAGDVVVLPDDCYMTTRMLKERLESYGAAVRMGPTAGDAQIRLLDGARLVWLETPSNPGLDVCDIARVVEAAHAAGALVAVDNTLATPLGQRPLDWGADFSVASDTKAMTGHGDLLLGHAAGRGVGGTVPRLAAARHAGDQLRRRAQFGGAARTVGRRRGGARVRPLLRRDRGHGGSCGGRPPGPGENVVNLGGRRL